MTTEYSLIDPGLPVVDNLLLYTVHPRDSDVLSPSGRQLRRDYFILGVRRLDQLFPARPPRLERLALLLIVRVPVVDRRHARLHVVENLADDQPRYPHARHVTSRRPPQVVLTELDFGRLHHPLGRLLGGDHRACLHRVREYPRPRSVLEPNLRQHRAGLSAQRHAMRHPVLRELPRDRPPSGSEVYVIPTHSEDFPSPLCRQQPQLEARSHERSLRLERLPG